MNIAILMDEAKKCVAPKGFSFGFSNTSNIIFRVVKSRRDGIFIARGEAPGSDNTPTRRPCRGEILF
jgi:hypothetical protein